MALNPVQELNGSNAVIANMLTGANIDEYFTRKEPGPLSYLTDALRSTLALTDSSGTMQNQYQYEPMEVGAFWLTEAYLTIRRFHTFTIG